MAKVAKRRGRYVLDYYDNLGKRRWQTLPKGTTLKQAKEKLREIEDQLSRGIYIPIQKIPTFKEIADDWLKHKKTKIRFSTWEAYECLYRNHLYKFDPVRIDTITTAKVEKFLDGKQESGMNLRSLKKATVLLNQIMAYAVRHKLLAYNPVRDAERPNSQGGVTKSPIKVLNPDEINAFLNAMINHEYYVLFKLAIMSGARQGELLGLKWTDIDWFNSQIHIQRTYNTRRWYKPKTKSSNRKIDLGPSMMSDLKKWNLACPANKLNLVFPNSLGKPIDQSNMIRDHYKPGLKAAGLPNMRFHDMRHTYASLLIEQGENIKYIQTQLGHSSPSITLDVYAHLMKSVNQEAACRLEKTIFDESGSKMVAKSKSGFEPDNISN